MCAAPGGKTTHLAMLMKDQGLLWAMDKNASKVAQLTSLCQRFGLTCVRTAKHDAIKALSTSTKDTCVPPVANPFYQWVTFYTLLTSPQRLYRSDHSAVPTRIIRSHPPRRTVLGLGAAAEVSRATDPQGCIGLCRVRLSSETQNSYAYDRT